ncbi:unnamed protein product [Trichobilharzia regenti]|nr:unnamed protein product [Trichobilharzia regenti]
MKVEKRRLQELGTAKEFSRLETALLIDRYRFLDLLPCSDSELRSLGYRVISLGSTLPGIPGSGVVVSDSFVPVIGGVIKKPTYPQPDVAQMLPFKPKAYPRTGSHPVAGGEFPPPPAASSLLKLLPPPQCFHGPFVDVDRFLEHFLDLEPCSYILTADISDLDIDVD